MIDNLTWSFFFLLLSWRMDSIYGVPGQVFTGQKDGHEDRSRVRRVINATLLQLLLRNRWHWLGTKYLASVASSLLRTRYVEAACCQLQRQRSRRRSRRPRTTFFGLSPVNYCMQGHTFTHPCAHVCYLICTWWDSRMHDSLFFMVVFSYYGGKLANWAVEEGRLV